jgi:hypothetical protein
VPDAAWVLLPVLVWMSAWPFIALADELTTAGRWFFATLWPVVLVVCVVVVAVGSLMELVEPYLFPETEPRDDV